MKETYPPKGVVIEDGIFLLYRWIHEIFCHSPFGVGFTRGHRRRPLSSLDGVSNVRDVRFKSFCPPNIYLREWAGLLGADVDIYEHGHLTYIQARNFLSDCACPPPIWPKEVPPQSQFSSQEQELLLLKAATHDWAEMFLGDKPWPLKTQRDDEQEAVSLKFICGRIFPEEKSPVFWKKLNQALEVIADRKSKLGQVFNAIERLGYFRIGLIAWRTSQEAERDQEQAFRIIKDYRQVGFKGIAVEVAMSREVKLELVDSLRWLTTDVFANHLPVLVDYSEIYPPVFRYLYEMRPIITSAFSQMPESIFEKYDEVEQASKKAQFEEGAEVWADFVRTNFDQNE
jgi:5'-deoxynucleotidase YfbR-like HD superfamily hydrolase